MRKLTPVQISKEESAEIQKQLGVQEVSKGTPKSTDPVNFPVFSIPVGKKVLVYVPNHTYLDDENITRLRKDEPLLHSVTIGKRFLTYRCTAGITTASGELDGSCPLCDGCAEPWDLANKVIEAKCRQQALDPSDTENQSVKTIRSTEFSKRAIKDADRHITFPIVVFETQNDDGKTFVMDENNNYKLKVMWYDCSEQIWKNKWLKALEAMEDEPTHPGGHFFLLNYIYEPKNGKQQEARDAARELTISYRRFKNSEDLMRQLDKLTEDWDPVKSREVVTANILYPVADLQALADEALEGTRAMLEMYEGAEAGIGIGANNAGFSLEKPNNGAADGGEATAAAGAAATGAATGALPIETDMDSEG